MKIAIIIPALAAGGAERVVSIIVNAMAKRGVDVVLLLFRHNVEYELDDRVRVVHPAVDYPDFKHSFHRIIPFVRRTIKLEKPDIVFSLLEYYNPFNLLALLGMGIPVVISDRNSPTMRQSIVHRILRRVLYPTASCMVAQTLRAKSVIQKKGLNRNVVVIPNPISTIEHGYRGVESKKIICVGRLTEVKNTISLIRCFARIRDNEWQLTIVGRGPQQEELERHCKELGIEGNVIFHGVTDNVLQMLSESAIFAFPSRMEGFPNALLEAMGVGLPCVAYDCMTGPGELIRDGENGMLVEPQDEREFEDRLRKLMNNRELRLRLGRNATEVREIYNQDKIVYIYLQLFEGIVDRRDI